MDETLNTQTNEPNARQAKRSNFYGVGSLLIGLLALGSPLCTVAYIVGYFAALINQINIPLSPVYAHFAFSICGLLGGGVGVIFAIAAFWSKTKRKAFPIAGIVLSLIGIVVIVLLFMPILLLLFSLGQA